MFDEIVRRVILVVVSAVLVLRTPFMVRDRRQRPLWYLLVVVAGGSVVIQSWFGSMINRLTQVSQFNNLVQGIWGVLDVAVTLEFMMLLVRPDGWSRRQRAVRLGVASAVVTGMAVLFMATTPTQRFALPSTDPTFTAYALLAAGYMIGAAGLGSWIVIRDLSRISFGTLYVAILIMGIANATEIPFMAIQTLHRLTRYASPDLVQAGLLLNTARFMLLPTGCVIAAVEPMRKAVRYYCRRVRIYPLWRLLRDATGELAPEPRITRCRDLFAVNDSWERLHLRIIEIRDSIFYLYDTWASPELLAQAARYAETVAPPEHRSLLTTACWLEATRRARHCGALRLHHLLDEEILREALQGNEIEYGDVRHLAQLWRTMRSPIVLAFTSAVASPTDARS
jgi:hypothetical protein